MRERDVVVRQHDVRAGLAIVLVALGACGGGDDLTAAGAVEESYRVFCERAFECRESYPGTEAEFALRLGADEGACVAMLIDDADPSPSQYQRSVDEGRIAFDAGAASECLAYYRDLTCAEVWDDPSSGEPAACRATFEGLVPEGGDCVMAADCADDGFLCSNAECQPPSSAASHRPRPINRPRRARRGRSA
jgi:hypothetical protein